MKTVLTDKFESFLRESFPCFKAAEEAIYDVSGVTIEDIRSAKRLTVIVYARAIFWKLCRPYVSQCCYLRDYINKDHATCSRYENSYYDEHEYDDVFMTLSSEIEQLFKNKMQNGNI